MSNEKMLLEDLNAVLKEAKAMGCTEVRRFGHIQLEKLEVIVNALEKQVAKKPTVLINDKDVKVGCVTFRKGVKTYKCVCGYWITLSQDYCNHCGQKIDWSEVDE